MTMTDISARIGQIQSTLQQLNGSVRPTSTSGAGAAATALSATEFAATLTSALDTGTTAVTTPAATVPANPGAATGAAVSAAAQKYLGVPYVFGGEDSTGMDCSGLVQRVYADLGIDVPRLVSGQMKIGTEVGSLAEAQPGDLIVTGGGAHILIYAGDNKVIHAPYPGRTVCLVEAYMTDADIDTIRRVIPADTGSSTAAASVAGAAAGAAGNDMFSAALAAFSTGRTS